MFNIYKLNARGEEEEETKFLERDLKRVDFNNCYYYLYPPTYLKNYHLYSAMSVPTVHTHTPEKRNTPMGRGFLVETREDGFEKVVLAWRLANNSEATIYTKKATKLYSGPQKVGDMTFEDRKNCWSYMNALRDSLSRNEVLSGKALSVLKGLLDFHPSAAEKKGCGVKSIKYGEHKVYTGTMCFIVVREDDTEEDFSFRKSIDVLFPPVKRNMNRNTRAKESVVKFAEGTVLRVDGLTDAAERGVEINFKDLKDVFGGVGKVQFVEMFGNHAEIRFKDPADAKLACDEVERVRGEEIRVCLLSGDDEAAHFKRVIDAMKNKRKSGGGRRGRRGGGRRGGRGGKRFKRNR